MNYLDKLAIKHGTDKSSLRHNYTKIYHRYFDKIRSNKLNFLEIGIAYGNSIKMWLEYFPNSNIFCMDNFNTDNMNSDKLLDNIKHNRCYPLIGDQSKRSDLLKLVGPFDIIIDDGSHKADDQQITLGVLFSRLNSGGFFFIEDLHTIRKSSIMSTLDILKKNVNLVKPAINSSVMTESEMVYINNNVASLRIYDKICLIRKK